VTPALKVPQDRRELRAFRALLERKVRRERKAPKDHKAFRPRKATKAIKVMLA
jgi:hypothetical protein